MLAVHRSIPLKIGLSQLLLHIRNIPYACFEFHLMIDLTTRVLILILTSYFSADAESRNVPQVTKRINDGDVSFSNNMEWNWQSVGDKFLNGAYFVAGGASPDSGIYSKATSTSRIVPAEIVPDITREAGPLLCHPSGGFC